MVWREALHMAPTTGSTKAAKAKTPDTRSKVFARQAHRESVAVRNSPYADDDQAFVDAISAWNSSEGDLREGTLPKR